MNIGLHKQIAAENYIERGKFIIHDSFKGKDYIKNNNTIVSNCHEILNIVTRQYLSHYLVESLPNEFVGYTSLTWFPHFFNVFYRKFHFKAICQSDKGISVIEHDNSVGVAFHPHKNYRETVLLLENFIKNKIREVQVKLFKFKDNSMLISQKDEIPLMFRKYKYNDEEKKRQYISKKFLTLNLKNNYINNVNNSIAFNRIKKVKNIASHVGMGFNNRDMIFVENNSIIQKPLSLEYTKNVNKTKENSSSSRFDYFSLKRNENTRISEIFKPYSPMNGPLKALDINNNNILGNNMVNFDKMKKDMEKNGENNLDYLSFIKREKMDENQLISYYKKTRRNVCQKLEEIEHMSNYKYHSYKRNKFKKSKKIKFNLRLKNSLSFNNNKHNNYNLLNKENTQKNNNTMDKEKVVLKYDFSSDSSSINNNINEMEAQYSTLMAKTSYRPVKTATSFNKKNFLKKRNFSNDSKMININDKWKKYENLSLEQIQRKEFLESKKKWMSKEDFHRVFGVRSTSIKPIPSVMIYGKPVSSHKYREIHPEKWITQNGFI
jgi:hypothetical protein